MTPNTPAEEKLLDVKPIYSGRLIRVELLTVDLGEGRTASREVVRHPGAAAILCELPDGRFVWVEQYRRAIGKSLVEVVAGTLEPGEAPAACARREVEEETGYKVAELTPLGMVYASPGFVSEALHLFHAKLDPACGAQRLDADERVKPRLLTADQVETLIADGGIVDSKSLCCWLRDRMRRRGMAIGS